ncbi:MAG: hypothetical protein IT561_02510 [Alphaproteobacteria bacterium]|nr:hypothetical protein [Alphaproteobacteria bacterium]
MFLSGDFPARRWPEAEELLRRALPPGLSPHLPPDPPTTTAAAVEAIAHALCAWAGFRGTPVRRTAAGAQQLHCAAMPAGYLDLPHNAMMFATRLLAAVVEGVPLDDWLAAHRPALLDFRRGADQSLSGSRRYIVRAAERRSLPWRSLSGAGVIIQVGEGRHARLFDGSATWLTGTPNLRLAGNKQSANRMLHRAGVPVARQLPVPTIAAARKALAVLGVPLVIKPTDERRQAGVTFVYGADELESAYAAAAEVSENLIAESYLPGDEYRALVISGRVRSVIASTPATVVGDGRSTIEELVEAVNLAGDRGRRDEGFVLSPILWNDLSKRFLAFNGHTPQEVLPAGRRIEIYPLPIMRFGAGRKIDVTDRVHPDNDAMLVRAAEVMGLDVAGIDLRMPDVARSWREVGAGLCEVNPQPALSVHYNVEPPLVRDVGDMLLEAHMPRGERWLMTHVMVVGDAAHEPTMQQIAAGLRAAFGWRVATATPTAIDLEGWQPREAAVPLSERYSTIIEDRTLDAAVYLAPAGEIMRNGLGFQHLDVALVDHVRGQPAPGQIPTLSALSAAGAVLVGRPSDPGRALHAVLEALRRRGKSPPR